MGWSGCDETAPQTTALVGVTSVAALRALPGDPNEVVALVGVPETGLFWKDPNNGVDNGTTRFNAGGIGSDSPGWERIV